MIDLRALEVWLLTGNQHLCGPETLAQVERQASDDARRLRFVRLGEHRLAGGP